MKRILDWTFNRKKYFKCNLVLIDVSRKKNSLKKDDNLA